MEQLRHINSRRLRTGHTFNCGEELVNSRSPIQDGRENESRQLPKLEELSFNSRGKRSREETRNGKKRQPNQGARQENSVSGAECIEDNMKTLQKKLQDDFAQMESVQLKVKALSEDWLETHQRLKAEETKVKELEAQIDSLNLQHERAKAALQEDMARARAQVKEKEDVAEKLRAEVAMLEWKVEAACQEAVKSAAELEKGAQEARLVLEATLAELAGQKCMAPERAVGEHTGKVAPCCQEVADLEESEGGGAESEGKEGLPWLLPKDTPALGQEEALPPQEANPGAFRPAASSEFDNGLLYRRLFSFSALVQQSCGGVSHNLAVGNVSPT